MNYYPFHLGDYAAHTSHLEPMEDLAYRRLIDLYYLREGPLPADIQATAKLVRMRSMTADVESVLNEFFTLTSAGWMHNRCEVEISEMQERQNTAKAKANKRWDMQRKDPSNAAAQKNDAAAYATAQKNDATAQKNGIDAAAQKNDAAAYATAQKNDAEVMLPNTNEKNTSAVAPPDGVVTAAAQKNDAAAYATAQKNDAEAMLPNTNTNTNTNIKNTSAVAPPDGVVESVWTDFVELRKNKKAKLTQTAIDGIRREADKAGWTLETAIRECCNRGWVGFKADWVAPKIPGQTETFKERDARLAREKWERMTGESHPENAAQNPPRSIFDVVDMEIKTLELMQ